MTWRGALTAYIVTGLIVISIGSNMERGCKDRQSTFAECLGLVTIWPLVALIMATSDKANFPCEAKR